MEIEVFFYNVINTETGLIENRVVEVHDPVSDWISKYPIKTGVIKNQDLMNEFDRLIKDKHTSKLPIKVGVSSNFLVGSTGFSLMLIRFYLSYYINKHNKAVNGVEVELKCEWNWHDT